MSVAEIKEELRHLTREERREIARVLIEIDGQDVPPRQAQTFEEAQSYVFDNYGDLLRRLAQ